MNLTREDRHVAKIAIVRYMQKCSFPEKSGLKNWVNSGKPKWQECHRVILSEVR